MAVAEILGWITNLLYALGLMPFIQAFVILGGTLVFVSWMMGKRD